MLDRSPTMWNRCKVEQAECGEQAGFGAGVGSWWRCHPESMGRSGERTATKSNLSRYLLNLKVRPTSNALKLYTTLSSTSTTYFFAPMFKGKLDRCIMNCDNRLRRFNETLTNWHLMSSIKSSCICNEWLCMTCSNNKVRTLIFVKKIAHLIGMHT